MVIGATIFPDALFQEGGVTIKAGQGHVPSYAARRMANRRRNGWGYIVSIGNDTFYDFGEAPAWFLDVFAERKAFIYALEILARVLAIATMARVMPPLWTRQPEPVGAGGPAGWCPHRTRPRPSGLDTGPHAAERHP